MMTWIVEQIKSILTSEFFAEFTFENDTVGQIPAGFTDDFQPNPSLAWNKVVASHQGFNKVAQIYDNDPTNLYRTRQLFDAGAQTNGEVSYWVNADKSDTFFRLRLSQSSAGSSDTVGLVMEGGSFKRDSGAGFVTFASFNPNTWYYIRFTFECGTDQYDGLSQYQWNVYIGGVKYGPFSFANNIASVTRIYFQTTGTGGAEPFATYIDLLDYSWASGWYQGRNAGHWTSYGKDDDGNTVAKPDFIKQILELDNIAKIPKGEPAITLFKEEGEIQNITATLDFITTMIPIRLNSDSPKNVQSLFEAVKRILMIPGLNILSPDVPIVTNARNFSDNRHTLFEINCDLEITKYVTYE
jgi:hypothetical protein